MRRVFDLYANLRPCRSIPHPISRPGINLVLLRENTEDLYAGIERVEENGDRAVGEMVITRRASERIARKAFQVARASGFRKVTVVHQANVLRETCGLFRKVALEVAKEFPEIAVEEMLVDTCAMELIRDPGQFDVLVTTNLFGDILSDEASHAGRWVGDGLLGQYWGRDGDLRTGPRQRSQAGWHPQSQPDGCHPSAAMLLEHIGFPETAARVRQAVEGLLRANLVTEDLGGHSPPRA